MCKQSGWCTRRSQSSTLHHKRLYRATTCILDYLSRSCRFCTFHLGKFCMQEGEERCQCVQTHEKQAPPLSWNPVAQVVLQKEKQCKSGQGLQKGAHQVVESVQTSQLLEHPLPAVEEEGGGWLP